MAVERPVLKFVRILDFVREVNERVATGTISIAEASDILLEAMPYDDVLRIRDAAINLQQFCEFKLLTRADQPFTGVSRPRRRG